MTDHPTPDAVHRDNTALYDDGAFVTCPDCGGDLQYQNDTSVLCLVCDSDYAHFYTPDGENVLRRAWTTDVVARVYDPMKDDRERTDGGVSRTRASGDSTIEKCLTCGDLLFGFENTDDHTCNP